MELKKNDQQMYNELADQYQDTKKKSIINILTCGKILQEAKDKLPYGMFMSYLRDTRVSESDRTAERLMAIHRNFGHLLQDPENKTRLIANLGVSHLLELKNLPDRFKKEIEVEKEVKGKPVKEVMKVIDEDKLSDFLEQKIEYEGAPTLVRDLPLDEMKKAINEANGIFIPKTQIDIEEVAQDEEDMDPDPEPEPIVQHAVPKMKPSSEIEVFGVKPSRQKEVVTNANMLYREILKAQDYMRFIDHSFIASMSDIQSETLKKDLEKLKENCNALITIIDDKIALW